MGTANNCNVPEDLYYWVEQHVWIRPEEDGSLTIGMTDAAQHLAGNIINGSPKAAGRKVKKGRSSGTVESSKWVGPIKSPLTGEIVESNEGLRSDPKPLNDDPYGTGWFVRIKADDWEADKADLKTGEEAVVEYEKFLKSEGIDCSS